MYLKIILFEDNPGYGQKLHAALIKHLAGKGEVKLFKPSSTDSGSRLYEDRLNRTLQLPEYQNPTLIVVDRDLSATDGYPGMSESAVKPVADMLGIPECVYARGESSKDFLRDAEQREARIVLSLQEGEDKFAQQIVSIAEGFTSIAEKLPAAISAKEKKSPGKLLASILGKPEYADKIALYSSGDQNRLASVLGLSGVAAEKKMKPLMCLLGYWLWDSVLRYPGVVVNEVAASSYLNIQEAAFKADSKLQALFARARYQGPFADAKGPMWWRGMLDDIIAESGFADGREFAERSLSKPIARSECCEDATKSAGYYCMLSNKPVSLENSKGGLAWFPRGADRVCFECYLHLKEWKYRGTSSKRIHILLHVKEEIQCSNLSLLRSTVRASYFTVVNDNATLLQSIRFDYGPKQDAHPIFHAQVTNEPICPPASETESLDFAFQITNSGGSWFHEARIPTSDMTFPSVLLCLAADHLKTNFFNDFLANVRNIQKQMPHPLFEDLKASLFAEPNHLRSSHWFAHCSQNTE